MLRLRQIFHVLNRRFLVGVELDVGSPVKIAQRGLLEFNTAVLVSCRNSRSAHFVSQNTGERNRKVIVRSHVHRVLLATEEAPPVSVD